MAKRKSRKGKLSIIAIHGVGDAVPGQIIDALEKRISALAGNESEVSYERRDVVVGGDHYPAAIAREPWAPNLYEVHWADVQRPKKTVYGVIVHLFRVLLASLLLAERWHFRAGERDRSRCLAAYRLLVEWGLVWSLAYTLLFRWIHVQGVPQPTWGVITVAIPVALAFPVVGWLFRNASIPLMIGGFSWGGLALLTVLSLFLGIDTLSTVWFSTLLYGAMAILVGVTLFLGLMAVIFSSQPMWQKATRCVAACLPIVVLTVAGTCIWTINPAWIGEASNTAEVSDRADYALRYHYWKDAGDEKKAENYLESLLARDERASRRNELKQTQQRALRTIRWQPINVLIPTTIALAILGALCLVGVAVYGISYWREGPAGDAARWLLRWVIGVGLPLLVLLVLIVSGFDILMSFFVGIPLDQPLPTVWTKVGERLHVDLHWFVWDSGLYARLGALALALVVPVGAIASDILGDIVFWAAPPRDTGSKPKVRDEVAGRFEKLATALLQSPNSTIAILAHSQGSVVAVDRLEEKKAFGPAQLKRMRLFTLGSPLHSLYKPFFGLYDSFDNKLKSVSVWNNCYRDGDYIGGSIAFGHCENRPLGQGGHVNYWRDDKVPWDEILAV